MEPDYDDAEEFSLQRWAIIGLSVVGFTLYLTVAAFSTVIFPGALIIFLAPLGLMILASAPEGRATSKKIILPLLFAGAILLPMWPVYIHLKLGPVPIITPPRLILYALSMIWIFDMMYSPLRRGHFIMGLRRGGMISFFVLAFFALSALSAPFAEGRSMAMQEFFRQLIIWLLPFCIAVTYIRRPRDFRMLLTLLAIGAIANGGIAIMEKATGQLLASILSPFITGSAEWLQIAQSQKIRDGVFRAQGTHTHPLSVGEFIALMAPFAIIFFLQTKNIFMRCFWAGGLFCLLAGALATSSRGALLAIFISLLTVLIMLLREFLKNTVDSPFKPVAGLFMLALVVVAPLGAIGAKKIISGDGGDSAARSSQARLDQIDLAWPKIMKRPVIGYGSGRAARILGYWGRSLTIDNYYLTLALDLGLPGPLVFAGLMMTLARLSLKRSRAGPPGERLLYIAFFAAIISLATTRTIVSMAGNLSFIYIMIGAFVGAGVAYPRTQKPRIKDEW